MAGARRFVLGLVATALLQALSGGFASPSAAADAHRRYVVGISGMT